MAEKTEKPTQKRMNEARKKGQVIKSNEIVTVLKMAVILGYLIVEGHALFNAIGELVILTVRSLSLPIDVAAKTIIGSFIMLLLRFMVGLVVVLIITICLSCIVQTGPIWAHKSLAFSFNKMNIIKNAKQIFSMKNLFEFGKNILKVIVLTLVFYYLLDYYVNLFQYLPTCGIDCGVMVTFTLIQWLWGGFLVCYIVFAIADYGFQYYHVMKELKMSKEDTKREFKDTEGNPQIKQKRREIQREITSNSVVANVKKSTVIVRNPIHIVVCLYYQPGITPLPQVVEKFQDNMALHIVKLAEKAGIPMVENIPLARALFQQVERGQIIPESLFEPVAELLRLVMDLRYDSDD